MDDSAGGVRILADDISKFWVELLSQIDDSGKREMYQWFMDQLRKAEKRANAKHFAESTGRIQQRACIILDFVKKRAPMRRLCRRWMKVLLRNALLANCRFGRNIDSS